SLGVGQSVALLFALGEVWAAAIAAGLYMVSEVIDHMDGELARLTDRTSRFGDLYDSVVALVNKTALVLDIGLGLSRGAGWKWAIAFASVVVLANLVTTVLRMRIEEHHGSGAVELPEVGGFRREDFN